MKVYIDSDEWYPVYFLTEKSAGGYWSGQEVEVDEDTVKRWNATAEAFNLMQVEMRTLSHAEFKKTNNDNE